MHLRTKITAYIHNIYCELRFGKITSKIVATAGHDVPAEIEYRDSKNRIIGYWAYGYFDPKYPYKGQCPLK